MHHNSRRPKLESQTEPRPARTASPPFPMNRAVTWFVAGSIRDRGWPREVTQTIPSPVVMSPPRPGGCTSITEITRLLPGSSRDTVPSSWLSTQTAPRPATRKRGERPTAIVASGWLPTASTRRTEFWCVQLTQTAPNPDAAAKDPGGTGIRASTVLLTGFTRAREAPRSVGIQTARASTASPPSLVAAARAILVVTSLEARSTLTSEPSPQQGTQSDPCPTTRPEHGSVPT